MVRPHEGLCALLLCRWSSSNFDQWPPSNTVRTPLSCKQRIDVSVVYQRLSFCRSVVTRTLTMATSGGRTPNLRVVSPFKSSLHPGAWINKRPLFLITWPPAFSSGEFRWVEGRSALGSDRESASSIEHTQVMRRATNFIPEIQGTSKVLHITLDIGAIGPYRCCFRSSNFDRKSARAFTLLRLHQRSIDLRPSFMSPCNGLLC